MDNQRWSHRTKTLDDLKIGTAVAIQNQTGTNPTKWDKTGIVIENKPNSKVMIRVDGSRRVTMRNRKFVRPMEPMLRNATRSEPARRRTAQSPQIRQELPKENPSSRPPVLTEHVDEVTHEERGGEPDVRFEEVRDTNEIHHNVDVRQDGRADDVRDGAHAEGHDDQDRDGLFENVTEAREPIEGSTRPKRHPSPTPSTVLTTMTWTMWAASQGQGAGGASGEQEAHQDDHLRPGGGGGLS
jgi:hypothetical protein